MPKLIIQIPCLNEEETLGVALAALPRAVPGFDCVEWLIINDGSTDRTVAVARECGVDHVVSFARNRGLAAGFLAGLEAAVRAGADVIVNTDADNQYCADDIPKLVQPILEGRADLVIGTRPISDIAHFSHVKKALQKLGSWVVRQASNTEVPDAPSGFRAVSRDAAMQLHVFNDYTYTLETIIQAGQKRMAVVSVPVRVNRDLRPSRLVRSIPAYVRRSLMTIVRIFITYRPVHAFAVPGIALLLAGSALALRFLYYYFSASGEGHVQSVILSALLLGSGFFLLVIGVVADLLSVNRKLLERIDWRVQQLEQQRTSSATTEAHRQVLAGAATEQPRVIGEPGTPLNLSAESPPATSSRR